MKRIISLSSIPTRFPFLEQTLVSLVAQETVSEVRLYIPKKYRRFNDYDGCLPSVPDGVKIFLEPEDYGPATKILPAARDFWGQKVQILFCDDDQIFPSGWAKKLFDEQEKRPREAVATCGRIYAQWRPSPVMNTPHAKQLHHKNDIRYRAARLFSRVLHTKQPLWRPVARAGYIEILFGAGGAVVRPDFFDETAFDIPEQAWPVDDIWLSAQLARKNIPIYSPKRFPCAPSADHFETDALLEATFSGAYRKESNKLAVQWCQKKYNIWQ